MYAQINFFFFKFIFNFFFIVKFQIEKEYNDRLKYIADLKVLVANNTTDKAKVRHDIQKLHAIWYPEISKIVDIINTNFTKFMCSMGFAGEVQITRKDEV